MTSLDTNAPDTNAPDTNAPDTNAPDTNAADTNAPDPVDGTPRPDPRLTLLFGAVTIGLSAIFMKKAHVSGTTAALYRTAIPALILVPFCLVRKTFFLPRRLTVGALLGGVFLGLDLVLWGTALVHTDATIPTLLANLAPMWTGIGMWVVFRKRPHGGYWIGASIAVVGAAILAGVSIDGLGTLNKYHLMAAIASMFYAGYILITQRIRAEVANITFLTYVVLGAGVTTLLWGLINGNQLLVRKPASLGWLAAVGLGSQLFGWLAINHSLALLPTTNVSVTLLLQPVATGVFSYFIFSQRFTSNQVIGSFVILAGIAYVNLSGRSQ
jgi:drug/metabolite transporter (DMT)-like permease